MAKATKALTDPEVISLVCGRLKGTVSFYQTDLGRERTEVLKAYNGKTPEARRRGASKYVSMDVFDAVEAMRANLLETFAGGKEIVRFTPEGPNDVQLAQVATSYTSHVFWSRNDGYFVCSDVIFSGLTGRVGIAKVWWHDEHEDREEGFEGVSEAELMAWAEDPEVVAIDPQQDADGAYFGTITRRENLSQVKVASVDPMDLLVPERARSLEEARIVAHRQREIVSELIAQGIPEDKLKEACERTDYQRTGLDDDDVEIDARLGGITGDSIGDDDTDFRVKRLEVYECYLIADLDGKGARRWKITVCGNVLLDKEPTRRLPFVDFRPIRLPHIFHGPNYAKNVIPTHNAKTTLTRAVLDHTVSTITPRYLVAKGGLLDARELMDDRLGGIVNVNKPVTEAVAPLIPPGMNPYVFQTLQMLDYSLEGTTGQSKLSQGLNKDVLSKQNSAALVEQMDSASQRRAKIVARNFAYGFLTKVFLLIYELAVENAAPEEIVEVAGNFVPVTPSQWRKRTKVSVDFHLGHGEMDREAEKWLQIHGGLLQSPGLATSYGPAQQLQVWSRILEARGVKDVATYLAPPQPPPPNPLMELEMEERRHAMKMKEGDLELRRAQITAEAENKALRMELDRMKAEADHALKSDAQDLDERKQEHTEALDMAELAIAQSAPEPETRAIASPG